MRFRAGTPLCWIGRQIWRHCYWPKRQHDVVRAVNLRLLVPVPNTLVNRFGNRLPIGDPRRVYTVQRGPFSQCRLVADGWPARRQNVPAQNDAVG
ncbi:hypothetical protein D3C71_1395130 [compost metagenome]